MMEDGFYWVTIDDDDPEVIELVTYSVANIGGYRDSLDILRCGDDRCYYKNDDGEWVSASNTIDVIFLGGKLIPPND